MAMEWEMAMNMNVGTGMGVSYSTTSAAVAAATTPAYLYNSLPPATGCSLRVGDLLDFSNHDPCPSAATTDAHLYAADPSSITGGSGSFTGETFSGFQSQQSSFDLYTPQCEDAAELEWLSKFVEDSFSDVTYQCGAAAIAPSYEAVEQSANGRGARSKRYRDGAVNSSSLVAPPPPPPQISPSSSSSEFPPSTTSKASGADDVNKRSGGKKGDGRGGRGGCVGVRRCTHCASEKTPQWRAGPLGPKTLCNACGVRHKSGRLVPEYRPAASPTFVLTQHSNSHRKVMELRRRRAQVNDPTPARPEVLLDDYGVC